MATGTSVSVQEYLHTPYQPDCDYVDGVVVERNLGEYDHAKLQTAVVAWFFARRRELGIHVLAELRVQVSPTRFRVPDLCAVVGEEPREQILTQPPFLCIEVLSVEDRLNEEVRAVLMQHAAEMERSNMSYTDMFKMLKKKMAKEKGIIL